MIFQKLHMKIMKHLKDITSDELDKLIEILILLEVDLGSISNLGIENLVGEEIKEVYEVGSLIVNRMVSNEIKVKLEDIPVEAFVNNDANKEIRPEEVLKLIDVIIYLDASISELDNLDLDTLDGDRINHIRAFGSNIINHMISEEVESALEDIP